MNRALIIGVSGQDGYYLSRLLHDKQYEIYGTSLTHAEVSPDLTQILERVVVIDLNNSGNLRDLIQEIKPDEVYYLAAHHFSSQSGENRTGELAPFVTVNLLAADDVLRALVDYCNKCKFFYAASSHIFGLPETFPQNELTPQRPNTPYGISKSAALHVCRYYREAFGLFTAVGILYNHESPRRGLSFITKQIARAAALAHRGMPQKLVIRSFDSVVDWGAAEDYVKAMWLTLQQSNGGEYIIASGVPHTVRNFVDAAFSHVGLNADEYISQDESFVPSTQAPYVGDPSKIKKICGWEPSISFEELVCSMVDNEIKQLQQTTDGE